MDSRHESFLENKFAFAKGLLAYHRLRVARETSMTIIHEIHSSGTATVTFLSVPHTVIFVPMRFRTRTSGRPGTKTHGYENDCMRNAKEGDCGCPRAMYFMNDSHGCFPCDTQSMICQESFGKSKFILKEGFMSAVHEPNQVYRCRYRNGCQGVLYIFFFTVQH